MDGKHIKKIILMCIIPAEMIDLDVGKNLFFPITKNPICKNGDVMSDVKLKPKAKKPSRTRTTKAKKTDRAIGQVSNGLGSLISWDYNCHNWKPADLRSLATKVGIDPSTIKDVPVTNGMHNAAALFKDTDINGNLIKAVKVHTDDQNGLYTFGLIMHSVDTDAKEGKGEQIDSVCYEPASKSFISKGSTSHATALIEAINFRVEHYTGNEFRKWVIMPLIAKWNAIRIMGGLYYVADQHKAELDALEKMCVECGVGLHIMDQMDTVRTRTSISNKGKESLKDRIKEVEETLKKWKNRKGRIRKDGQDSLLSELRDIRVNADLLRTALSAKVTDLTDTLDIIKTEAESIINNQPTKPLTSNKVLQQWRNAMRPEYKLGETNTYIIPFDDLETLTLPNTAKQKYYYKPGKRLSNALAQLGYVGMIKNQTVILNPMSGI